jgi:2-oxoisovalerate dehydrogenase E1 component
LVVLDPWPTVPALGDGELVEAVDEHFVGMLENGAQPGSTSNQMTHQRSELASILPLLFDAQVESRHLDFAARWLQSQGKGYYTIGSAGHEANAAVGLLSRIDDPALLHYRSGGFYAARARRAGHGSAARDVLLSLACAVADPMSGGRHKVFGHPALSIVPQTSTIGSHLPRAVGLGFAISRASQLGTAMRWPVDSVVICSFGDASTNHSTVQGSLNAAAHLSFRGIGCPVLFVCEDNGWGISTKTPAGWPNVSLSRLPHMSYWCADGEEVLDLLETVKLALITVRDSGRPGVLHLKTVRFMGHAGSDAEIAYRSSRDIEQDFARDPIIATAVSMVALGLATRGELLARYEDARSRVMALAQEVADEPRLAARADVTRPLAWPSSPGTVPAGDADRIRAWGRRLPESGQVMTLAQSINAALTDLMIGDQRVLVFGEDVAVKGGVYGVTRGLRRRFGPARVFDTILDEQTILGVALGAGLAGMIPIPEIQYLAYLHNAEDQLRGEAASLSFFSDGQFANGMVVRIAGLAYQKGFGGHFHNDNSVAALRDIPGVVIAVPSHPAEAPGLLRACYALARNHGRVCLFLEPIARYHTRDLREGDLQWCARYDDPTSPPATLHEGTAHGDGDDVLLLTFGNGVYLSRLAADQLTAEGIAVTVADLRWLAPLPHAWLRELAHRHQAVLVVDETRESGGVSEAVVTSLVEGGVECPVGRVAGADTYIPLGPAAETVLISTDEIVRRARELLSRVTTVPSLPAEPGL